MAELTRVAAVMAVMMSRQRSRSARGLLELEGSNSLAEGWHRVEGAK
jgi:hypothetical protein